MVKEGVSLFSQARGLRSVIGSCISGPLVGDGHRIPRGTMSFSYANGSMSTHLKHLTHGNGCGKVPCNHGRKLHCNIELLADELEAEKPRIYGSGQRGLD